MRKAAFIGLLTLAGCITHPVVRPLRPLEIPTAPYEWTGTSALTGSLLYEGGCLLFHDDKSGAVLMPVWPYGTTFNGTAVMFHRPAKMDQPLMVNEEFVITGRPLQWTAFASVNYQPFQRQCGAEPFFVTSIRPAD